MNICLLTSDHEDRNGEFQQHVLEPVKKEFAIVQELKIEEAANAIPLNPDIILMQYCSQQDEPNMLTICQHSKNSQILICQGEWTHDAALKDFIKEPNISKCKTVEFKTQYVRDLWTLHRADVLSGGFAVDMHMLIYRIWGKQELNGREYPKISDVTARILSQEFKELGVAAYFVEQSCKNLDMFEEEGVIRAFVTMKLCNFLAQQEIEGRNFKLVLGLVRNEPDGPLIMKALHPLPLSAQRSIMESYRHFAEMAQGTESYLAISAPKEELLGIYAGRLFNATEKIFSFASSAKKWACFFSSRKQNRRSIWQGRYDIPSRRL